MFPNLPLWLLLLLSAAVAFVFAFLMTPPVKRFAEAIGAIDVPTDDRRMHTDSVPRLGGLAIFLGFVLSMLVFGQMTKPVMGMLVGAIIIVAMGALDDIIDLNAWIKLAAQIVAAIVAVRSGIIFNIVTSPFTSQPIQMGVFAVPITILWIVGCTNAVNLIDGLDGLAVGVSAISSLTMLIVALFVAQPEIAVILAALVGACIGFMPYNLNPAKIFMGDVGSQFLGFTLATVSLIGLFKLHAIISFLVPIMALGVPLADTISSFFRRILHGQSPFHADKGHFHHKLLQAGLTQKQAVAVLYGISAILGLVAIVLSESSMLVLIICVILIVCIILGLWLAIFRRNSKLQKRKSCKDSAETQTQEE